MKIAMLSPIAWRTPPRHYGPWELVASNLTEGLVAKGHEVTLFATADSLTSAELDAVCPRPYAEDDAVDAKVWESLHISNLMENADRFDIVHNHFDFLPLTYSRLISVPMVTTIHGFSSEDIVPVYRKYDDIATYISISDADRHPDLNYERSIFHGIDAQKFQFNGDKEDYLLFFGRIHPDKGAREALRIAEKAGYRLIMAGLVQDAAYFEEYILPKVDGKKVIYLGNVNQKKGSELLGRATALLHPIAFDEPFGLSVAEAMMCGTPVIAYNRGSMPELIEDNTTGFLVKTVEDAALAVEKAKSLDFEYIREYALNKFGMERMVEEYVEVYEEVLLKRES